MKYRPDIDGLRAFAVLSVVIFHAEPRWLQGGFVGVDIFFVISGFLISSILFKELDTNSFSFRSFYARRVRRIVPALFVVVGASLLFGWIALFPDEYSSLGKHSVAGSLFVSNFVFWQESGYFDKSALSKPLLHLWSLSVEEQFYLFWPILVWFLHKRWVKAVWGALAVGGISFVANVYLSAVSPDAAFFLPAGRMWELLSGASIAWLLLYKSNEFAVLKSSADRYLTQRVNRLGNLRDKLTCDNILSSFGLVFLVASVFIVEKGEAFPGFWVVLPVAGSVFMIVAGPQAYFNRVFLANKVAIWIGLISYPLYLWHWPLLSYYWIVEGASGSVWGRIALVSAAVGLAWLTCRFVEMPMRYGAQKKRAVFVLGVLSAVLLVFGGSIVQFTGFPGRENVVGYADSAGELIRSPSSDGHCARFIGLAEPKFPYCRVMDVGATRTVAVIGDSHAHAAFPGIAEGLAAKGMNTLLLANSGCPPLLGHPTGATSRDKEACQARMDQILSVITARRDIQDVIFVNRGPIYWTGFEPLSVARQRALGDGSLTRRDFFKGTQATVSLLAEAGLRILYVTENPELNVPAEYCIRRPLRSNQPLCELSRQAVLDRQSDYLNLVSKLVGATILYGVDAFCEGEVCKIYAEKNLLYADDDHLSVSGSKYQYMKLIDGKIN